MDESPGDDALARARAGLARRVRALRQMDGEQWRAALVAHWRWALPLLVVASSVLVLGLVVLHDYRTTAVPPPGAATMQPPTVLVDARGHPLRKLEPAVVGEQVSAATLPDHVVRAVLAAEDRGYRDHGGFSVRGTLRALFANLRNRGIEQGGSTITQQYVDLTTPGPGRSYRAKLREMVAAVKYEDALGKGEILDRYLNVVPFGRDTSGIDAAAQVYFGVPASRLDVNQAATLAGMIAAPSAYDPSRSPQAARDRRDTVLGAMGDAGWLPPHRVEAIRSARLPPLRDGPLVRPGPDAYFVDAVRRRLEERFPDRDLSRGLVVHTTIDPRLQAHVQRVVADHVGERPHTAASVTIDPTSGAVRALVGGSKFTEESFNAAVMALRQPGSAFKPFTLAAFVDAGYAPHRSRFVAPREIEVAVPGEDVTVENFGGNAYGELTVHDATVRSVNTVYMQLIEEVGPPRVAELARAMGVRGEVPAVPSLALGTASVSPLSLASGYATLAAGGVHRPPHLITEVRDAEGRVLHAAARTESRILEPDVANLVTDVLGDVVAHGTGQAADIGRPVAGKTGTTDDSRDAWFVGYTPQLVTAVWVGNADNAPMPEATGGELAAPIWADIMGPALAALPVMDLPTGSADGLEGLDRTPPDPPPSPSPSDRSGRKDKDRSKPGKPDPPGHRRP